MGQPRESTDDLIGSLAQKLAELEGSIQRQSSRFNAVLEIGAQINSARDIEELLKVVMARLTDLVNADASTLFMLDSEKDELWSRVIKGAAIKEIRIPASSGVAGAVVSSGRTLSLGDAYVDERFNPEIDRTSGFRTRSIVAAPMRHVSGRVLGVVEVLARKVNAFNTDDQALVEAVAAQIAAVLENVVLMEQLRTQNQKLLEAGESLALAVSDLDLLYQLEKAITASQTEADLLDVILGRSLEALRAKAGAVVLLKEGGAEIYGRALRPEKGQGLVTLPARSGLGVGGFVAESRRVVRTTDPGPVPEPERSLAKRLGISVESVLCVPIEGEGVTLGALEFLNKKDGFTEADERVATLIAGQAARALEHVRSRTEGERRARLATIGQALSGLVHDLRSPMTIVSGYAQMMALEDDPQERQDQAGIIEKQIHTLNAMIRETLAFARGDSDVFLRKVDVAKWTAELEVALRQQLDGSSIELKFGNSYNGYARIDDQKLCRAIYNIARNAQEAMPRGGRLTVSVDREGTELVMRLTDTGPGIPDEIEGRLFESFVTAGKKEGTGLGLAIVKKIATDHGGQVSARSKPGKGATFEIRVPTRVAAT